MNPIGIARTEIEITDLSVLIATGLKGVIGVLGITERGPVNTPTLIGSWIEYQRVFGGLLDYEADWRKSSFPLLCKRALEAGAKLRISRVAEYSDITDYTTLVGDKATLDFTQAGVGETLAEGTLTVTAAGTAADTLEAFVAGNSIGIATIPVAPTTTTTANALIAAINAATGTNGGYTAALSGANVVVITAPTGSGATANGRVITYASPSATATLAAFSGGITEIVASDFTVTAKSIGYWGNDVTVTVTDAYSGNTTKKDITVALAGYPDLTQTVRDVNITPSVEDIEALNQTLKYADFSDVNTTLFNASGALLLGTQDVDTLQTIHYIGDVSSATGLHSFDDSKDIVKICVPELAVAELDIATVAYAELRKDLLAIVRTPAGADGQTAIDYREGVLSSTTPISNWRGIMVFGDHYITHPTSGVKVQIPVIGDALGRMSNKDNVAFEWFSWAGQKRGRIPNSLGMVYNLGTAARETLASAVVSRGINPVIEHDSFGVVLWGNSTLQKEDTLLKKANVAEFMIFLTRSLKPLIETEFFDPNDIQTWKNIYRRVSQLMEYLKANRGVYDYLYQGDQDIDTLDQAVVNESANITAGQYKFNLFVQPIPALEYAGINVIVTNSGVSFEIGA